MHRKAPVALTARVSSHSARVIRCTGFEGATPILLLLPVHPRLSELATPLLPRLNSVANRVAAETRGAVVDASALLGEDAFADAVHPNESGRATLSTHVGRLLPAPDGR